jgi:hypothetical protein
MKLFLNFGHWFSSMGFWFSSMLWCDSIYNLKSLLYRATISRKINYANLNSWGVFLLFSHVNVGQPAACISPSNMFHRIFSSQRNSIFKTPFWVFLWTYIDVFIIQTSDVFGKYTKTSIFLNMLSQHLFPQNLIIPFMTQPISAMHLP